MTIGKAEVVREVRAQRRATVGLLRGLSPSEFDLETALPGWRIREVAAHLITTDRAAVTGSILPVLVGQGSTDPVEAWNERQVPKWAGRSVPELIVGLDRWGRRFARLAARLPSAVYRLPLPTPWGRGPAGLLVWLRAYDEWVHRQDVRRALGMEDEQVDLPVVAGFLLTAIGMERRRRPPRQGGRVAIALEGVPIPEWRFDLTDGLFGPAPLTSQGVATEGAVDARISAPGAAFVMAAAGRDPFERLRASGALRVEGDQALGEEFLLGLRIV